MSDEQKKAELVDEENQAVPVFDEFILTQLAEAAEAEDRERVQADEHFARLRRQFPSARRSKFAR
jgi:hypothetical protein